MLSHRPND